MRITIRNKFNKPRSDESIIELKKIDQHIKKIRLEYSKGYFGYYGKKRPFQGFDLLWSDEVVRIIFAGYYDKFQDIRKDFIVCELTHVR